MRISISNIKGVIPAAARALGAIGALGAVVVPSAALAGGNGIPNENARDLALAQAAVANQTGAEAVILNTAALAGQEGLNISAAGELLINRTDWTDSELGSASLVTKTNTPPTAAVSFGAKLPNGMAWGAGVGFGVPAGGTLIWPNGWAGQERIQSVRQKVYEIAAGAAFQPLPYLKLGASWIHYRQVQELHQEINYLDHFGDAGISLAGDGNTFGVAGEFTVPTIPLTIAVTYKHDADITLKGDAHFEAVPETYQPMIHDQDVTEELTAPSELYIGAAYEAMPGLKVMAAYSFEHWTVYKSDTFVGSDDFTVVVPRNLKNAYVLRFGGEWEKPSFLPALTMRLGVLRSMSDQPGETVSPSLTDGKSTAVSAGAGYNILPSLRVDLGYQHAFFDKVRASGSEAFPGSYNTQVDLISLGVNWRTDLRM